MSPEIGHQLVFAIAAIAFGTFGIGVVVGVIFAGTIYSWVKFFKSL